MASNWWVVSSFLTVMAICSISAQKFGKCEKPENAIPINMDLLKGVWFSQVVYDYGNESVEYACSRSEVFVTSANIAYIVGSSFDENKKTWLTGFVEYRKISTYEIRTSYAIYPTVTDRIFTLFLNETDWVISGCHFHNGTLSHKQHVISATRGKTSTKEHNRALMKNLGQSYTQEHAFSNCEACYDTRSLPCHCDRD